MGGGFSLPTSFPSLNNAKRFGSGIIDKLPSANNFQRYGSKLGNYASKVASATSSALTSKTSKNIATAVGKTALLVATQPSYSSRSSYRRRPSSLITVKIGGKETISSKKEKNPSKKETNPPKKETKPYKKEKKPSKKEKKPSKK
jgi:hypothetical protein